MNSGTDIVKQAGAFGAEVIEPGAESWDAAGSVPREFFQHAASRGLCRLLVPTPLGGLGLDLGRLVPVLAALAQHCMASTFALVVHNNLAGAIARYGSDAQQARYLEPLMRGEKIGAFLLTEPGAGSDAAAITTTATAIDNGWLIAGEKAWISNAQHADVLSVYARTDVADGARGIAGFLLDADLPGSSRTPGYALLGGHALGTGGFSFADVKLGADAVLHAPGTAFAAAMRGIDIARVGVAAMCTGTLARSLDVALEYTAARPAFGQRVGDFQGVEWMLAECATDLEAARALTARAAGLIDRGEAGASVAAAHAKKFASRAAFTRIADCMQVMGAAGLSRDYPLARHLAAAKMAQFLDGATEIQNVVIARGLKQTPRDA